MFPFTHHSRTAHTSPHACQESSQNVVLHSFLSFLCVQHDAVCWPPSTILPFGKQHPLENDLSLVSSLYLFPARDSSMLRTECSDQYMYLFRILHFLHYVGASTPNVHTPICILAHGSYVIHDITLTSWFNYRDIYFHCNARALNQQRKNHESGKSIPTVMKEQKKTYSHTLCQGVHRFISIRGNVGHHPGPPQNYGGPTQVYVYIAYDMLIAATTCNVVAFAFANPACIVPSLPCMCSPLCQQPRRCCQTQMPCQDADLQQHSDVVLQMLESLLLE